MSQSFCKRNALVSLEDIQIEPGNLERLLEDEGRCRRCDILRENIWTLSMHPHNTATFVLLQYEQRISLFQRQAWRHNCYLSSCSLSLFQVWIRNKDVQ